MNTIKKGNRTDEVIYYTFSIWSKTSVLTKIVTTTPTI